MTMITPSYLGETIEYSSLHACRSTLEDPTFSTVSIKYREYHCLGATKLVLWPSGVALSGSLACAVGGWHVAPALWGTLLIAAIVFCIAEIKWTGRIATWPQIILLAILASTWLAWQNLGSPAIWFGLLLLALCFEARETTEDGDSLPAMFFVLYSLSALAGYAALVYKPRWAWLMPIGLLAIATIEPQLRRHRVARRVQKLIENCAILDRPPHVIAHSFGTYLVGRALRDRDGLHLGRLVLFGCVLPPHDLAYFQAGRVEQVRNEYGPRDWIVRLAHHLGRILPFTGLGGAGLTGFSADEQVVHHISTVRGECDLCNGSDQQILIHNVYLNGICHSNMLLTMLHPYEVWFPYLISVSVIEFNYFKDISSECSGYCHQLNDLRLKKLEGQLKQSYWSWFYGRTFEDAATSYIKETIANRKRFPQLRTTPVPSATFKTLQRNVLKRIFVETCLEFNRACTEARRMLQWKPGDPPAEPNYLLSLDPLRAFAQAVKQAIEDEITLVPHSAHR